MQRMEYFLLHRGIAMDMIWKDKHQQTQRKKHETGAGSAPIALDLLLSGSSLDRDFDARYERILREKYEKRARNPPIVLDLPLPPLDPDPDAGYEKVSTDTRNKEDMDHAV